MSKLEQMRDIKHKLLKMGLKFKNSDEQQYIYIILTEMLLTISAIHCKYNVTGDNKQLSETLIELTNALKDMSIQNLKNYKVEIHGGEKEMIKIKA